MSVPGTDTAAPGVTAAPQATATAARTETAAPTETMTPPIAGEPDWAALPQVAQAKDDLAGRLGVAPEDIAVVEAIAVTWPNGALGCPQPGMAYAEVLVEGLQIRLAYGGHEYAYHSGGSEAPFLCTNPEPTEKGTPFDPNT